MKTTQRCTISAFAAVILFYSCQINPPAGGSPGPRTSPTPAPTATAATASPAASPSASPASSPVATATPLPAVSPGTPLASTAKGIFLHHSTGGDVWGGGVPASLAAKNAALETSYAVTERGYPDTPWPWANYPADYYRLWVGTSGNATNPNIYNLETLAANYDLIVWKHCYPVMEIGPDSGAPDPVGAQTLANYKAAYEALKTKMRSFPGNRFIVWTGAVELSNGSNADEATRLREFRNWVINTWDEPGDNVFVFDFWLLETGAESALYLDPAKAAGGGTDNHPSSDFCLVAAPLFAERIMDVMQGRGDLDPLTGLAYP